MSAVNTSGIPQVLATDAESSGSDRNLAMFAAPASSSAREEFHRFLDKVDIVEMVFYWSILVVGVPCNLIVSVLLIMRKRLHAHAYQLLILAIALSDMCVLLSICLLDSLFYLHRSVILIHSSSFPPYEHFFSFHIHVRMNQCAFLR